MGGSSKSQIVGYKYFFGLHMGIGRGPVDALHEIRVADKQAWYGRITKNQTFRIKAKNLFGGESKEGGVDGPVEVMMGEPDQQASSGLKAMLGSLLPGFRGMFTIYYNGLVSVNNPYPKAWKFRLNRVLKGWDGPAWYPSKAQIPLDPSVPPPAVSVPPVPGRMANAIGQSGDIKDAIPLSIDLENPAVSGVSNTYLVVFRLARASSLNDGRSVQFYVTINGLIVWSEEMFFNGQTSIEVRKQINHSGHVQNMEITYQSNGYWTGGSLMGIGVVDSETVFSPINAEDGQVVDPEDDYTFGYVKDPTGVLHYVDLPDPWGSLVDLWGKADQGAYNKPCSMNPAHIIYECLTNRVWGRGLATAKLDLDSFLAAANTLHGESFGLCLKWTRKDSIENFIQGVIDHIGATLYVSRTTKLYTLKLIRGGYNLNDLPLFDTESGILTISDATVASVGSTVNAVHVKYHDWENDEERSVSVKNAAAIAAAGGVVNQVSRDFPGIPVASLALRVAQRELRAVSTALRKFTITMDRRGEDFAPGDVFAIQDPKRGIPKMAVRVGRVEDGTLLDGKITLTVVQDVFTLPATTMAADVPSTWVPPNNTPCIDQQMVFEAPYFLMARTMTKADLDYVGQDSGYIATLNSRGQPLNQGYKIAVRPDAPTSDDNPPDDSYVCGI